MVKRRGGRRTVPIRVQSSDAVTKESSKSTDTVVSSPAGPASDQKNSNFPISPSNLEGLVSEKSLYVKIVDIARSKSNVITGVNCNPASAQADDESNMKVKILKSGTSGVDSNASSNRNSAVGIVSRVVTRSRRVADIDNTLVDKVTTVGVIKTTRRTSRTGVKNSIVDKNYNDYPGGNQPNSVGSSDMVSESPKNEPLSQTDDDDPCLSGDIMYEQIIEDDLVESMSVDILSVKEVSDSKEPVGGKTDVSELDISSKPSSTSDCIDVEHNEISKQNVNLIIGDDSKVSSSCNNVSKDIFSDPGTEIEGCKSSEYSLRTNSGVSMNECHNIKALSSLKLEPGVEPVSSSKADSYFEPIFSIDDNSRDQTLMDVDLEESKNGVEEFSESSETVSVTLAVTYENQETSSQATTSNLNVKKAPSIP